LARITQADSPPTTILEVGAGAGNTAFPILQQNQNPGLKIVACDFSNKAIELIRGNPLYTTEDMVGSIEASVWDVASPVDEETRLPRLPDGVSPGSVDVIILIFIFSALEPRQWEQAVKNVWTALRPGGVVLFRDYGRGDLAQVRFKKQRYLEDNFYVRGDGTRVYFFEEDELQKLWTGEVAAEESTADGESKPSIEALQDGISRLGISQSNGDGSPPKFEMVNFGVDRRMLVNRQRRLKMYRCWMQGLFRKPLDEYSVGLVGTEMRC
jgi:tRNAThr (cytosine32-N3)-methyltransferase